MNLVCKLNGEKRNKQILAFVGDCVDGERGPLAGLVNTQAL